MQGNKIIPIVTLLLLAFASYPLGASTLHDSITTEPWSTDPDGPVVDAPRKFQAASYLAVTRIGGAVHEQHANETGRHQILEARFSLRADLGEYGNYGWPNYCYKGNCTRSYDKGFADRNKYWVKVPDGLWATDHDAVLQGDKGRASYHTMHGYHAWRDASVSGTNLAALAVPLPPSIWLMMSSLAGFSMLGRKRRIPM